MNWQATLSWKNAQKRAQILQQIRQFFAERQVVEVETPALSQGTVTDVYLDAFTCQYSFLADSTAGHSTSLYLQTSPEFHMKRLLACGYGCIFQIAKAFRHEESGRNHNPEFTMLEWYRIGFDQFDLMHEVAELLQVVLGGNRALFSSYQDIFMQTVAVDPLTVNFAELVEVLNKYDKSADWLIEMQDTDLLLQFIFTELIEPTIGINQPQFIYDFPITQASLARVSPEDSRVAQRFECYYHGIELVNGFNELTDANEQQIRFEQDNAKRAAQGLSTRPIDKNFIAALTHGLPQCSGVALGIDRLVMLALDIKKISEVQSFSIERA
ncbi:MULTISPECIES: elongation factor P--(R)-beta-lysine ligase [Colwellia]|uniref:Elongation factor P--(R)-beta-lysine ligase n=1 Tax=Colwellia marinimaniae TaxID=1513592 RepID=A0ABQ0MYX1_9GAMM|nr:MULTISPECIES: elongation factor P--(R)-beta-lysine ligase [Colwellia]GAW97462.1 elongation factor P--(R)-beta-lysine ligase [Colwellia marinimaniae]